MFDKLSIRYKLVVLLSLSLGLGLLVSALVALYSTWVAERQSSLRALHQIAAITSENMRAALAFEDRQSAAKLLSPLHTDAHILYAWVQDASGQVWGQYYAPQVMPTQIADWTAELAPLAQRDAAAGGQGLQQMRSQWHYVIHPVAFEGQHIGAVVILADNTAVYAKMWRFIALQGGASVVIFMAVLLLAWWLQRIFTRPILDLLAAMRTIARTKDYAMVLNTHHTDEFSGLYAGFNAMLQEIRARDEQLSRLATTDALTGLANRGHILHVLHDVALRGQRQGTCLGMVLLDIDHFKRVNDSHGHPAGDLVLREVAGILQAHLRPYDRLGRFGGEEFFIVCDGAGEDATAEVAERIRAAVANHGFRLADGQTTLHVTVSLGVWAGPADPQTLGAGMEAADRALYQAKQGGRDRVGRASACDQL